MQPLRRTAAALAAVLALAALAGCRVRSEKEQATQQTAPGEVSVAPTVAPTDTNPITALQTMGSYLRGLKEFKLDVDATKDEPLNDGQNLQFGGTVQYLVRAPNSLRVELRTDRKYRDYFYDGKTLTIYGPRNHFYATVPAPPTIRALLDTAAARYDLEFPVADIFLWGTDRAAVDSIKASAYVGPATIRGRECEQYVYRQHDVDWQLWIERGSRPLPCKLVITTKTLPSRPQYTAVLTWDLTPNLTASTFAFTPPKDAHAIKLDTTVFGAK